MGAAPRGPAKPVAEKRPRTGLQTGSAPPYERHVFICLHQRDPDNPTGDCISKGAEAVLRRFKELVAAKGLEARVRAQKAGCLNACAFGPSVVVYPDAVWYAHVRAEDVEEIVESHLAEGIPVERLRLPPPSSI